MRNLLKILVLLVVLAVIMSACSKKPEMAIDEAKAAIDSAAKEGAEVYAKEELTYLYIKQAS